jgi:hypothetical protein
LESLNTRGVYVLSSYQSNSINQNHHFYTISGPKFQKKKKSRLVQSDPFRTRTARNRRVKDSRRSVTGPLSAALARDICGREILTFGR